MSQGYTALLRELEGASRMHCRRRPVVIIGHTGRELVKSLTKKPEPRILCLKQSIRPGVPLNPVNRRRLGLLAKASGATDAIAAQVANVSASKGELIALLAKLSELLIGRLRRGEVDSMLVVQFENTENRILGDLAGVPA